MCVIHAVLDKWLALDNIDRRSDLSVRDFRREYEMPLKPVIITDATRNWPCMREWICVEDLLNLYGDIEFEAEAMTSTLTNYVKYAANARDDSPIYLFDKAFV